MKFTIDKSFNFEMGHRVWAQKLDHAHLSLSTDCACKHLHGHSYKIKVFLGSDELDHSSMVTDFKNLNFMKQFVDDVLDHKFMIDINDPHFSMITGVTLDYATKTAIKLTLARSGGCQNLGDMVPTEDGPDQEMIELHRKSFVVVDFVPTSENMCKFIKEYAQSRIDNVATVTAVELWETEKSHSRYE